MGKKSLKSLQNDKIFVTGKFPTKKHFSSQEDIGLLSLQLACPKRTEISALDVANDQTLIENFYCLLLETKQISSLIFFATIDELDIKMLMKQLSEQIQSILKSSSEKILFVDFIEIHKEKFPYLELMVNFADVSFVWESPKAEILVNYFKLPKVSDKDRYDSIKLDDIESNTPVPTDMFLFFPRNNRYIHYVKKGGSLEEHRRQKLERKGINRFFTPKGQLKSDQNKRVNFFIENLLRKYADIKKTG